MGLVDPMRIPSKLSSAKNSASDPKDRSSGPSPPSSSPTNSLTQPKNLSPYFSNLNSPTPDTESIWVFVLGFMTHMETRVLSENTI